MDLITRDTYRVAIYSKVADHRIVATHHNSRVWKVTMYRECKAPETTFVVQTAVEEMIAKVRGSRFYTVELEAVGNDHRETVTTLYNAA